MYLCNTIIMLLIPFESYIFNHWKFKIQLNFKVVNKTGLQLKITFGLIYQMRLCWQRRMIQWINTYYIALTWRQKHEILILCFCVKHDLLSIMFIEMLVPKSLRSYYYYIDSIKVSDLSAQSERLSDKRKDIFKCSIDHTNRYIEWNVKEVFE